MLNAVARVTIQFGMVLVIRKICRGLDDPACDENTELKKQPLVGRFNSRGDVSACDDNRHAKLGHSWDDSTRDGYRDS